MTPNKYHLVLFATTIGLGASGHYGFGRREAELECNATFRGSDVLPGPFGAVVDLIGWVDPESVAGGGVVFRRWRLDWLHHGGGGRYTTSNSNDGIDE